MLKRHAAGYKSSAIFPVRDLPEKQAIKLLPRKILFVASFLLVEQDAISGAEEPGNCHHTGARKIPRSRGRIRTVGQKALQGTYNLEISPELEALLIVCMAIMRIVSVW